jgi:hypothetical protein
MHKTTAPVMPALQDWSHITKQIGMFAYTGLSAEVVDELLVSGARKRELFIHSFSHPFSQPFTHSVS